MKQLIPAFLLVFVLLLLGCKKSSLDSPEPTDNASLDGRWLLTETLSDPGDGSGKWKTVNASNAFYVKLNTDSTIESSGLFGNGSYKTANGTMLEIAYPSSNKVAFLYKIKGQTLTLSGGGCIEACGWKFKKTAL